MITNQHEYFSKLHLIQAKSNLQDSIGSIPPINIPNSESKLKIDLNTRKIEAPEFLSVKNDQKAETFFFEVDRFYNHIDLALTTCIIQYITPKGPYIYPVPFYDTVSNNFISVDLTEDTYKINKYYLLDLEKKEYVISSEPFDKQLIYFEKQENGKMLIPWQIGNNVTKQPGQIEFNVRFYTINFENQQFDFNLSTLSAKSKILPSMDLQMDLEDNPAYEITDLDSVLQRVQKLEREYQVYWTELD